MEINMIFHLDEDIYNVIKTGTKNVEVRLNDEKRRNLKKGDIIKFINRGDESQYIVAKIIDLSYYDNFEELIKYYDIENVYLKDYSKEDFINLLTRFYTLEDQQKYGVVAISFEVIEIL